MRTVLVRVSAARRWLVQEGRTPDPVADHPGPHRRRRPETSTYPWWKVMCLSGVDYFSTLGYQPGIALVAAGLLSPLATVVLVLVTLVATLPVYRKVAEASPGGSGSLQMVENLFPRWGGKIAVLVLLGFACTDFMITMTLSAADAAVHLVSVPVVSGALTGWQPVVTVVLLLLLSAVFLKGFGEAIRTAVVLVPAYLVLNAVVLVTGAVHVLGDPVVAVDWSRAVFTSPGGSLAAVGLALVVFPKLALGLSGFETGVTVMSQVRENGQGTAGRIRGTKALLTTSAVVMSVLLLASSLVTTLLVPAAEAQPGGAADGRALSYLAHLLLGEGFGTVYDLVTIGILWFAGASAMAGLLNMVPRFLPRYGMAPEWARAHRPLVLVVTLAALLITWVFDADVDAQGAAYATGVLVLMLSAAVAVAVQQQRRGSRASRVFFWAVVLVFVYLVGANVVERPAGLQVSSVFILTILVLSLVSRVVRSSELRVQDVRLTPAAEETIAAWRGRTVHLVAHHRRGPSAVAHRAKLRTAWLAEKDRAAVAVLAEVVVTDPSDFETPLHIDVESVGEYTALVVQGTSVSTGLAALALYLQGRTGQRVHLHFQWAEGSPVANYLRFLFLGEGQNASQTHEIIRRAVAEPSARPLVHVV